MIDGELQCLGSLAHLQEKFAQGFTVTVKTHVEYKGDEEYRAKLLRAIRETFPDSKLQQSYEGFLEYHMADMGLPWSQLFELAEALKRKLNLLEFLISDTTLDHVYEALGRKERGQATVEASPVSPLPEDDDEGFQ
ncbi:phospholipid-transporting ATPase ABCA3-like [Haemaphysalis longicornis]